MGVCGDYILVESRSASTNYFEVDLEGVSDETNHRLQYFVALFSASSLESNKNGLNELDSIYEEGLHHAKKIEDDLGSKIFEGRLFISLVKAVLSYSNGKTYSQTERDAAKSVALRLLYRLLFVLYAESRDLLPIKNETYKSISLGTIVKELSEYSKKSNGFEVWERLEALFHSIENGKVDANLPEYDGELFRYIENLDKLRLSNEFLVPAMIELCSTKVLM